MSPFPYKINVAVTVALIAVGLDVLFHATLTTPMESFDYFAVKVLIGFFVATIFLNWPTSRTTGKEINFFGKNLWWTLIPAILFTFLMSLYYRWWEYLSGVPYGIRPPDIVFIDRNNTFLFALSWFIAHSVFFLMGAVTARLFLKEKR